VPSSFAMNCQVCQTTGRDATTMSEPGRAACENGAVGKALRRLLGLGLLAGVAYAIWRKLPQRSETSPHWEPQPFPFPPQLAVDDSPWIEPAESGTCPAHHPVKAKLASGIFHVPGGANYARTRADRCYRSADAAEADGLRQSKN
jgi:hypothetical protein